MDDCYFYHTIEIPGHGLVSGEWDLRGVESQYLGGVPLTGKRVLEIGAASGFLTMYMEAQGAEVIAYDLSEAYSWDIVPFEGTDYAKADEVRKEHLRKINNGFRFTHQAHQSQARFVHGTVYAMPDSIGEVDIATFGSMLLHLRDPFLALQSVLRLVKQTAIVTDVVPFRDVARIRALIAEAGGTPGDLRPYTFDTEPIMQFLPQYWDKQHGDIWWLISPDAIQRFLGVLGFERMITTYSTAMSRGNEVLLYTVVGHRQ